MGTRRRLVIVTLLAAASIVPVLTVEPGKPSVTALEVTAYRAIGAKHPNPAIRNGDYLAERFLGADERAILREAGSGAVVDALQMETEKAWASFGAGMRFATTVHARTRYYDAEFENALAAGATQAVILGAGLDSRAYRFRDKLRGAPVFEVDFPPTQEYKKNRVRSVLKSLPGYVRYVPIDFATEDLATVLARAGYDTKLRTVFIWEGVTFYIPEAAVDATLRFVATHSAPGSRILFDYFPASVIASPPPAFAALAKRLAGMGEPFVFGLPDDDREGFITRRGLTVLSDLPIDEVRSRYLPKAIAEPRGAVGFICTAAVPARPPTH